MSLYCTITPNPPLCRAAAGVMVNLMGGSTSQNDVEICLETENKARQQLLEDWSTYQASDREGCIQANVYLPSYTEWLTCFEMNKSVREGRQQHGREMIRSYQPGRFCHDAIGTQPGN
jgi:hypothetical protein